MTQAEIAGVVMLWLGLGGMTLGILRGLWPQDMKNAPEHVIVFLGPISLAILIAWYAAKLVLAWPAWIAHIVEVGVGKLKKGPALKIAKQAVTALSLYEDEEK